MNNKGFTMIEVLAAFLLLGILATFATVSVIDYLDAADDSAKELLKENIKSGLVNYYNECKYLSTGDPICKPGGISVIDGYKIETTISKLAEFGFLESQADSDPDTFIVKDPTTEEDISACSVSITYDKTNHEFSDVTYLGNCGSLN